MAAKLSIESTDTVYRDPQVDLIITNPPFSLALQFLEKSLSEAPTVVYLLRLRFLASVKRGAWWHMHPPTHQFVLSKRPSFTGDGRNDSADYAWFAWDRGGFITTAQPFNWLLPL